MKRLTLISTMAIILVLAIGVVYAGIGVQATEPIAPSVITYPATSVTTDSARLNGDLISLGTASSVIVSFEWGTTAGGPYTNVTDNETWEQMTSTGSFSANLTGLTAGTAYYYRAKAVGHGTCYGQEMSFITCIPPVTCRWTGGGTIGDKRDPRETHGFELHCNVDQLPNNLEVNWGGNHFHLDALTRVVCSDDPTINPRPPRAGCDTIHGWGVGQYNGVSGYKVEFIFTDAGEPGRNDWAWIKITASNGDTIMEVSGFLRSGNQQAHNC